MPAAEPADLEVAMSTSTQSTPVVEVVPYGPVEDPRWKVLRNGDRIADGYETEQAATARAAIETLRVKREAKLAAIMDMLHALVELDGPDTPVVDVDASLRLVPTTGAHAEALLAAARAITDDVRESTVYGREWEVAGQDKAGRPLVRRRPVVWYAADYAVSIEFPAGEPIVAGTAEAAS